MSAAFILSGLSAIAALAAAAFWLISAGIDVPNGTVMTADGNGWQPVATALSDQASWSSYGALCAAVAVTLQAAAMWGRQAH